MESEYRLNQCGIDNWQVGPRGRDDLPL